MAISHGDDSLPRATVRPVLYYAVRFLGEATEEEQQQVGVRGVQATPVHVAHPRPTSTALGHRGANLRRFVQEANLSHRRAVHVPVPEEDWVPVVSGERRDEFLRERKRWMDWSDYLEDLGECDGRDNHEKARDGDIGIQVTTELPEKRAPKAQLGLGGKSPKIPVNATLPKRQLIEEGSLPCSAAPTAEAQRSKWSNYLDTSFSEEGSGFEYSGRHCTELECSITDVVVDDEVHPDFV